jgi:16S rRNA (adenine1518-N6/adenine1519-N6)-dimethyltransferase
MKAPLGQNFLVGARWHKKVAEAVGGRSSDALLEIGGGKGDISELLAERVARLVIVELDRGLAEGLRQRFHSAKTVEVLEADILDVDLAMLSRHTDLESAPPKLRVFGNLPYYVSSPILHHLFRHAEIIQDATLMLQREVADRVLAKPGTRDFGLLSATAQLYVRGSRLFDLPPGAFRPAPKVTSSLIRLEFVPRARELAVDEEQFVSFLKTAFAQKRKRLTNNLKASYPADQIENALSGAGVNMNARAEELDVEQLAAVFKSLSV